MSEPFLGEIMLVGYSFAPRGWANCDGQLLPISSNQALFSLLGTTYGGDGRTTFALPDLRSRAAMHRGGGFVLGQRTGSETETLSPAEVPQHDHGLVGSKGKGTTDDPAGATFARQRRNRGFHPVADATAAASAVGSAGGGQAHNNMQPFTVVRFVIALQGLFPSRN